MEYRRVELNNRLWDKEHMQTDPEVIEKAVLYEKDPENHVARIIFNVPEKMNAVPIGAFERVRYLIEDAETDDDIKVIIFKGNGPCFGTGADASELGHYIGYKSGKSEAEKKRPSIRQRMIPDRNFIYDGFESAILECLKATICQVHNYCYGAHFQMALAADIVVAAKGTLFTHPAFRYLGPLLNFNLAFENLPMKKIKEMVLTTRPIDAQEALQYGMVNKVVPLDRLEEETNEFARAIAVLPIDAIMTGKALIWSNLAARGMTTGTTMGWIGHALVTNLRFEPGEWNFVKERREKGLTKCLKERDEMVSPYFRQGKSARKKKVEK